MRRDFQDFQKKSFKKVLKTKKKLGLGVGVWVSVRG
jgi:hypothetical protein